MKLAATSLLVLALLSAAGAQGPASLPEQPLCHVAGGETKVVANGFTLVATAKSKGDCSATVYAPGGMIVYQDSASSLSLIANTGGVTGDGTPVVILDGYSGGVDGECCSYVAIVSLGAHPGPLWQLGAWAGMSPKPPPANWISVGEDGAEFVRDPGRNRVAIEVKDEVQVASGLPPRLQYIYIPTAFEMSGRGFVDVSRAILDYKAGRTAKAALNQDDLRAFLASDPSLDHCYSDFPKPAICPKDLPDRSDDYWSNKMTIEYSALEALYAGDVAGMDAVLGGMWPAADRPRIRAELIGAYCGKDSMRSQFGLPPAAICPR